MMVGEPHAHNNGFQGVRLNVPMLNVWYAGESKRHKEGVERQQSGGEGILSAGLSKFGTRGESIEKIYWLEGVETAHASIVTAFPGCTVIVGTGQGNRGGECWCNRIAGERQWGWQSFVALG